MLRHAGILARSLLQARGFSLAFLVTLSVALGGSTVVFGVVRTLLFRPLPYSDVERLVVATPTVTWGMYTAMRDSLSILEKNAAYIEQAANVSIGPHIERAMVAHVTSGFFEVTGVKPSLGRLWDERESGGGSHPVVLISHNFKRRHFGSEGDAIGKTLVMDGEPRTVIGVLPVGFGTLAALEAGRGVSFDTKTALLVPLPGDRERPFNEGTDHVWRGYVTLARLRAGVPLTEARRQVSEASAKHRPARYVGEVELLPVRQALAPTLPAQLALVSAAIGLLLLTGCANAINLSLERLETRRQQLAVRLALGASFARVAWAGLEETLVLAMSSGVLGVGLAWMATAGLRVTAGSLVSGLDQVRMEWPMALFGLGLSVIAGIVVSLVATLRAGGIEVSSVFQAGRQTAGRRSGILHVLVVAQIALAVVLVVVGGLLARDLRRQLAVDLGFQAHGVLTAEVSLNPAYRGQATGARFVDALDAVGQIPGITAAAITSVPPQAPIASAIAVQTQEGVQTVRGKEVSRDYFSVLSIPIIAGRSFADAENVSGRPVVVVNREFAERRWGSPAAAIEKTLTLARGYVVVGVVENSLEGAPGEAPQPTVYLNHEQSQRPVPQMTFLVRGPAASEALARSLTEVVRRVLPGHPLYNVLTLDRIVSAKFARERLMSSMMLVFALLALLVAGGGVHGAVAYAVTSRIHEIGVRRALGGSDSRILSEVVRRGLKLVAAGLVVGMPVALGLRWLAESQFVGASGTDFFTCVMAIVLVLGVGAVACTGPARRALRIDPIETLRLQ